MAPWRAWSTERFETTMPAVLVGSSLLLDALAEDGGGVGHGAAFVLRTLAAVLCAVGAVRGLGRFGDSPLALRFTVWRGCGLLLAAFCLALELLARWPAFLHPTEGGFALDLVGTLWILLTGSTWGGASWERLAAESEASPRSPPQPAPLGWGGLGTSP